MAARAHMERFGTTSEDFGRLAILCRTNALDNERAMMRRPMTMDDYLASAWISEPFRLFDCCLETDRAVAIAIVSADRAKDLPHRPAPPRGAAWGGGVNLYNNGTTDLAESPVKPIAKRLYHAAGCRPRRHRLRRALRLFHLHAVGPDRGLRVRRGRWRARHAPRRCLTGPTETLPVNTHGGPPSQGYLHGFNHVYEAVEQIRGEAEHRQVDRHDVGLVAGQLGYITAWSLVFVLAGN